MQSRQQLPKPDFGLPTVGHFDRFDPSAQVRSVVLRGAHCMVLYRHSTLGFASPCLGELLGQMVAADLSIMPQNQDASRSIGCLGCWSP